jgi:RNA polymerase sigma-70 factor (sigma-E family)
MDMPTFDRLGNVLMVVQRMGGRTCTLTANLPSPSRLGVAARQHSLLRSAYLLTGDLHRAEDLLQDALLKAALRWGRLRDGNPDAYVRTILYRDHISWWRGRRDSPVSEIASQPLQHDDDAVERHLMLWDALARLTPKQRAVPVLRYYEDLTERQTAEALNVSVGTVKSQSSAALHRLREIAPDLQALLGKEGGIA